MIVRSARLLVGAAVLTALAPMSTASADVVPFSESGTVVDFATSPDEDLCFGHQAATLNGSFEVAGHIVNDSHILTRSRFNYTVRFADPSIPLYTGRQIFTETGFVNHEADVFVYNFHSTDIATASDGSKLTFKETIHFTFKDGILKAEVNDVRFTCP